MGEEEKPSGAIAAKPSPHPAGRQASKRLQALALSGGHFEDRRVLGMPTHLGFSRTIDALMMHRVRDPSFTSIPTYMSERFLTRPIAAAA
jgi:hypothetical protein